MSKARYRKQKVVQVSSDSSLNRDKDYIAGKDASLTSGDVSIATIQEDYYPWDVGAHIIAENIESFQINTEFTYFESPADKTHRAPNGDIISQIDSSDIGQDFVIVPQRYVLDREQYLDVIDTSITELLPSVVYGPTGPPILRANPNSGETTGVILFPSHGTIDGKISDGYSVFDDPAIKNTVYQFPGNHSRVLVIDAYNYLAEDDIEIEDGLTYEWVFNSDNPAKHGLETRKRISNKIVSKTKKLSLTNADIFDTGLYHCRIKNKLGVTETAPIYILVIGGLVIERDEIRNPETNEFLGFGAPTGEVIADMAHNSEYKLTDGWFDFNLDTNEWIRTAWDNIAEEWYVRDNYRNYNPWRTPKYGPEPKFDEVPDEVVVKPTKTTVVNQVPEIPVQPKKREPVVQPQQRTVTVKTPAGSKGRSTRIISLPPIVKTVRATRTIAEPVRTTRIIAKPVTASPTRRNRR